MRLTPAQIDTIKITAQAVLGRALGLSFAVLVGSRANGTAHPDSDWDIAIQWSALMADADQWVATEQLRQALRQALQVPETHIDLIGKC